MNLNYLGMYRILVCGKIPISGKFLLDKISVFEIGETGVKTLEQELKSFATQALSQTQKNVSEPRWESNPQPSDLR